jgi:mitotic spindle assembly checkpoint protein MAD1
MEKEVARLREESKKLHEVIGNKLLLEEQVADLKSRLERVSKDDVDTVTLKVQIKNFERELADWRNVATEFLPQKSSITPMVLRSHIQEILQKDLIMTSEKSSNKTEKCEIEKKLEELEMEKEANKKLVADLKKTVDQYKLVMARVQKKLQLVVMERDSFRSLVER